MRDQSAFGLLSRQACLRTEQLGGKKNKLMRESHKKNMELVRTK